MPNINDDSVHSYKLNGRWVYAGVIHKGDAGYGRIRCRMGLPASAVWTWKPEEVTCKACIAAMKRDAKEGQ